MALDILSYAMGKAASTPVDPDLVDISITSNGTYTHPDHDGYDEVTVNVPNPSTGKVNITDTSEVNVTNYATAQVVDADLVAGNIKKDVNILGVTGSYEGGGGNPENGIIFKVNANNQITDYEMYANISIPIVSMNSVTSLERLKIIAPTPSNWGYQPFKGCTSLVSAQLDDRITVLTASMFYNCTSLTSVNIPQSLTEFLGSEFEGCIALAIPIVIPSGCQYVRPWTFYNCVNIPSVTFKGTPIAISNNAFKGCSNLRDIYVPWSENEVADAPWGATSATIHYNTPVS